MAQKRTALGTQADAAASPGIMGALVGLLKVFVNRYIVAEHRCAPPEDGRRWAAVPAHTVARAEAGYQCPECGQNFQANQRRRAEFGTWAASFQREGVA
jgi:hypothetical protein